MNAQRELLRIEVEDVEISKLARLLTSYTTGVFNRTLRFVGKVDGDTRYESGTFSSNHMFDPMNPDEAYAPRMAEHLAKIRHDIEADGWVETEQGAQSWALTFARPAGASASEAAR
ncbi:hypothetical protein I6E52_07240 [Salinibacterium sp. NG253]|uniref:hypothetical protein n=1 Tax=unclassified Salinibacterium TaxID=2632331 RepID=UPI0018CC9617|nr:MULTISPECIES: hypothetical protein [unclassified Salinibacterium]MBH0109935.1 hypothetical protein [Salinibacterium sp. NG22]MBH0116638.1 hypothetical protein [Salinibacterium sp. NG253]